MLTTIIVLTTLKNKQIINRKKIKNFFEIFVPQVENKFNFFKHDFNNRKHNF